VKLIRYVRVCTYDIFWYKKSIIYFLLQELPTLPEHLRSPPVFSGVRVTRSLVVCVCFVDPCLSFCAFSFAHCVVCSSRLTRRVPLVEQELPTLPEHLSSPTVFSGVRVTRSLVVCVCFADHCLSFCTFPFAHCVVCYYTIDGFWLPPFGIFKLFLDKGWEYAWKKNGM